MNKWNTTGKNYGIILKSSDNLNELTYRTNTLDTFLANWLMIVSKTENNRPVKKYKPKITAIFPKGHTYKYSWFHKFVIKLCHWSDVWRDKNDFIEGSLWYFDAVTVGGRRKTELLEVLIILRRYNKNKIRNG